MSTKKIAVLAVLVLTVCGAGLYADGKVELGFKAPFAAGIGDLELGGGGSTAISAPIPEFLPIPYAMAGGDLDLGPLYVGVAAKLYTAIVQSVIYPELYAGIDLEGVQIQISSGGLFFGTFGVAGSGTFVGDLLLTDLSVSFEVIDDLYIGVGAIAFTSTAYSGEAFPFLAYVSAKVDLEL